MRAIRVDGYGGPEVLLPVELADPVPGPGEVVVRAEAVDTIYVETQIRGGWGASFGIHPPYVPGGAAAGTVVAVGEGVDPAWRGRRVVAAPGTKGTYAELVRVPAELLVPVPDGLESAEAAALAHDGVTGSGIVEGVGIEPGDRVLILGAAGGMGTLLVQMAVAAGAYVVGAARGGQKLALVRELGADRAVDYTEPGWTEAVGGPVDVLLDGVGGELGLAGFGLVRDGGRVSAHGAPSGGFTELDPAEVERRGIALRGIAEVQFPPEEITRLAGRALAEAAAGRLRPVIARRFPLAEAADAHRAIEARAVAGKALLIP
ncbi:MULTISPECIES: zinc-binding dehydrogenase [unclassified Streptomyces]|uniref:Zinc-binding dehydrogenase n=1 Tax=Streptomyces sp. R33 TaxID=3238629 RepID=A0AB39YC37_9ACTN|nr:MULTISPECIES: zinc-binding dehydrogenase [unclassified Streptomyces]KOY53872.1 NADPH:quinone reductase [Streptomyces sp. XY332]TDU78903.1 NADPH2:quinone reductase [Streptomyces sp. KS 21]